LRLIWESNSGSAELKQRLRPLCYSSGFEQNRKLSKITDKTGIDLTELKLKIVLWSSGGHGVAWDDNLRASGLTASV
jgi:hypothetical protein